MRQALLCFTTQPRWVDKFICIMHGKMDTVDQEKTTEINQLTDCEPQLSGRKITEAH